MFEPLIFSDLDGTLIFSASRKQPGDIVCEYKDNREISCITKRQAELLPGLAIVPVTTRSIEQYRRTLETSRFVCWIVGNDRV